MAARQIFFTPSLFFFFFDPIQVREIGESNSSGEHYKICVKERDCVGFFTAILRPKTEIRHPSDKMP